MRRLVWVGVCVLTGACPRPSAPDAGVPLVDAGPPTPTRPSCPADRLSAAEKCELVRAIFHLEGANGHEVEWYAADCAKWPVKLDVAERCGNAWLPLFGDQAPDCADEKMIAVNLRSSTQRERGLLLRLSPADGGPGYAFSLSPGQLAGEPKEIDSLCGSLSGSVFPNGGEGWNARVAAPVAP